MEEEKGNKKTAGIFSKWIYAVICLSLILNVIMYSNIRTLKREVDGLQNSLASYTSSIDSRIYTGISQISDSVKKENSMVSDFSYEFGEYKGKRVDINLVLKLKEYKAGEKVYFSYKAGSSSPQLVSPITSDNISFTSKLDVSVLDNVDIDLIIDDGSIRKSEKLGSISSMSEKITSSLSAHPITSSWHYENNKKAIIISISLELLNNKNTDFVHDLSDVKAEVCVNDKIIKSATMPQDYKTYEPQRFYVQLSNIEIPCSENDTVAFYITAKDDKGFSYRCFADGWKVGANGSPDYSTLMMQHNKVEISE